MQCFTLGFLESLIIWIIIAAVIIGILQLLIPWLQSITFPIIGQVIQWILWGIIAIMVVMFIFSLLSCLVGGAPFHLPR